MHRLPLEKHLPVVGLVHPGDAARQHRLAQRRCRRTARSPAPPAGPGSPGTAPAPGRSACRCPAASTAAPPGPPPPGCRCPGVVIHLSRLRSMSRGWPARDGSRPARIARHSRRSWTRLTHTVGRRGPLWVASRAAPKGDPAAHSTAASLEENAVRRLRDSGRGAELIAPAMAQMAEAWIEAVLDHGALHVGRINPGRGRGATQAR